MDESKRILMSAGLLLVMAGSALAQATDPAPDDWQSVIKGQIAAFHAGDGAKALSFASAQFRDGFEDPQAFLSAVAAWGYAPILTSRSESYGKFTLVAPDEVVQSVTILGPDMVVYLALYDLQKEADGWRVRAVQMTKTGGMGA